MKSREGKSVVVAKVYPLTEANSHASSTEPATPTRTQRGRGSAHGCELMCALAGISRRRERAGCGSQSSVCSHWRTDAHTRWRVRRRSVDVAASLEPSLCRSCELFHHLSEVSACGRIRAQKCAPKCSRRELENEERCGYHHGLHGRRSARPSYLNREGGRIRCLDRVKPFFWRRAHSCLEALC